MPKAAAGGQKARKAGNPLEAKPILGKLSGPAYESFSTIRESIRTYINKPNLQPDPHSPCECLTPSSVDLFDDSKYISLQTSGLYQPLQHLLPP